MSQNEGGYDYYAASLEIQRCFITISELIKKSNSSLQHARSPESLQWSPQEISNLERLAETGREKQRLFFRQL